MKKVFLTAILTFMFFFKSSANTNYEKIFFDFEIEGISGDVINFKNYENKVILLVNTASHCGFTKQYEDLQSLWNTYQSRGLIVLGVPSDSFNQEKKDSLSVKDFCEVNFNITFPLTAITNVKGENAHDIFKWAKKNYGKSAIPKWNFHKILIDKNGKIFDTFASFTNPKSSKIISAIDKLLKQKI